MYIYIYILDFTYLCAYNTHVHLRMYVKSWPAARHPISNYCKDLEMIRFGTCRKSNFKDRLVVNGEATEICFLLAFARSPVWVLVRK